MVSYFVCFTPSISVSMFLKFPSSWEKSSYFMRCSNCSWSSWSFFFSISFCSTSS